MQRHPPCPPASQGVSLIEALVALAVMSFGMLALIGVQSTMRINTDLSRQTSEATSIATRDLESMRLFVDVMEQPGQPVPSWDELEDKAETVLLPGNTGNVSFDLNRSVVLYPSWPEEMVNLKITTSGAKIVQSTVTWTDRTDMKRTVRLHSVVAATAPALAGLMSMPPRADAPAQRYARHPTIPVSARDLGNGSSGYKPSITAGVVWVFNNKTGYITSRCTSVTLSQAELTAENTADCPAVSNGRLLAGTVRFHLAAPPLGGYTAHEAEDPLGAAGGESLALAGSPLTILTDRTGLTSPYMECYNSASFIPNGSSSTQASAIEYMCLMYLTDTTGWGGKVDVAPVVSGWSLTASVDADDTANRYRVCRYTQATSDYTDNRNHPRTYCRITAGDACTTSTTVRANLPNQNFLVVSAKGLCPTDSDNNAATGQDPLVNANTRAHQPSS